jgi:hypothetical protein
MTKEQGKPPSCRTAVARAYEKALFAGRMDEVASHFTEDVICGVAGEPPIGGEWRGRNEVIRSVSNREQGLGAADRGYRCLAPNQLDGHHRQTHPAKCRMTLLMVKSRNRRQ